MGDIMTDQASSDISIEVAYATPSAQWVIPCQVQRSATIERAIKLSGILAQCPELVLEELVVGVFSVARRLSDVVKANDRIEIYRPLVCDPKDARRVNASSLREPR